MLILPESLTIWFNLGANMKSLFFLLDCFFAWWFFVSFWAYRSDRKRKIYGFEAVPITFMLISVVYFGFRLWFLWFLWR